MAFTHYTAFTVQAAQVPSAQTNFPVLLTFTDARFKTTGGGGHVQNASGFDLRPYSNSGLSVALTYQLVAYDSSAGTFEMWVLIPSLSNGYVLYLGYGDAALSSDGSSTSTFNTDFKTFWHLKDNAANTTVVDSSQSTNTGTTAGTSAHNTSDYATTGKIGGAFSFDATHSDYALGANTVNTANATVSIWVKVPTLPSALSLIAGFVQGNASGTKDKYLWLDASNRPQFTIFDGATVDTNNTTVALTANTWALLHGTTDGSTVKIYVNGTQAHSIAGGASYTGFSAANILFGGTSVALGYLTALFDEYRIMTVAASADWITTEYNNQNSQAAFWTMGTESPASNRFFILTHPA